MHPTIEKVLARITTRSEATRVDYERRIQAASANPPALSCGNIAHACAACPPADKQILLAKDGDASASSLAPPAAPAIGIVTAYNDMLSAHQPFERFPPIIRAAAARAGGVAQVAGGVPAMCDGITQGQDGMELSLFSRDVIAMASAVALSHNTYSAALFLGVCDKIVPGLAITAAAFGHLPAIFAPAGPMPSGLPNADKARVREQFARGEATRADLLAAEAASYHAPGTCTFYGTANTNQVMLELMGLQLPGASFVNPNTPLRDALTRAATKKLCEITQQDAGARTTAARILTPAAFVNAVVGVLASGGSTNHTLHLPAMARACGVILTWEDFADLSQITPLLARLYPNGQADVNHFHAAGGVAFLVRELLAAGLLVEDVATVAGGGLSAYTKEPFLTANDEVAWRAGAAESLDTGIIRSVREPFSPHGGLVVVRGNLGQAIVKTSAIPPLPGGAKKVVAPARIFHSQAEMMQAFYDDKLDGDLVCVVRFQGASANGMPELHKLTPLLSTLQARGRQVALLTDGRMSGASGKVPAAIHLTPEAARGGALAKLREGDMVCLDWENGRLDAQVDADEWQQRAAVVADLSGNAAGCGRELFAWMRQHAASADAGGGILQAELP